MKRLYFYQFIFLLSHSFVFALAPHSEQVDEIWWSNKEEIGSIWDAFRNDYSLHHGTSSNNIESIKRYGLNAQYKPFASDEIRFYEDMHYLALGRKSPLSNDYKAQHFFFNADRAIAESYAKTGPEVIHMMLRRIPEILTSSKLSDEQLRRLREIYEKYSRYMETHRPVIVSIKGSEINYIDRDKFIEIVLNYLQVFPDASKDDVRRVLLTPRDIRLTGITPDKLIIKEMTTDDRKDINLHDISSIMPAAHNISIAA